MLQLAREHLREGGGGGAGAQPPLEALGMMRAFHHPRSGRTYLATVGADQEEASADYGFFLQSRPDMLVTSHDSSSHKTRQAYLLECSPSRQGLALAMGPAGTGKTETFKGIATELGRPFIMIQFANDVDFDPEEMKTTVRRLEATMTRVPSVIVCMDELLHLGRPASAVLPPLLKMLNSKARSDGLLLITFNGACLRRAPQDAVKMTPEEAAVTNLPQPLELPLPVESGTMLDRVWTVLDRPPEPRVGGLGEFTLTSSRQASFMEFTKPNMKLMTEIWGNTEGFDNDDANPHIGGVTEFFDGVFAASESANVLIAENARILSERPFHGGNMVRGNSLFQGYFQHAGAGARSSCLTACQVPICTWLWNRS